MTTIFVSVITRVSHWFARFAALLILLACVVVCQSVTMRYLLEASTIWQTEFVKYSIVAATLLGSAHVLAIGGHVEVDLLSLVLGKRARKIQQIVARIIAFTFCLVLGISGWRYFSEAWREGWVTESVWAPPLWLILLPLPLGIGLLCLQFIAEFVRNR